MYVIPRGVSASVRFRLTKRMGGYVGGSNPPGVRHRRWNKTKYIAYDGLSNKNSEVKDMLNNRIGQRSDITKQVDSYLPFASTCLTFESYFEQPAIEEQNTSKHFLGWFIPKLLGRFKESRLIDFLYPRISVPSDQCSV